MGKLSRRGRTDLLHERRKCAGVKTEGTMERGLLGIGSCMGKGVTCENGSGMGNLKS